MGGIRLAAFRAFSRITFSIYLGEEGEYAMFPPQSHHCENDLSWSETIPGFGLLQNGFLQLRQVWSDSTSLASQPAFG